MKNLVALVSVSLATLCIVAGCSSAEPVAGESGADEEPAGATAKPDETSNNTTKSDQPADPVPPPSASPDAGPADPAPATPTPADPAACAALSACCTKLNAQFGALACNLIQQKVAFDCAKAASACETALTFQSGGGAAGITLCGDDADCPAGKTCKSLICL
jgi:hypothetical protein